MPAGVASSDHIGLTLHGQLAAAAVRACYSFACNAAALEQVEVVNCLAQCVSRTAVLIGQQCAQVGCCLLVIHPHMHSYRMDLCVIPP